MITDPLSQILKTLKTIDTRLTTIENKVSKHATKDDLKSMVTKSDIKSFATKENISDAIRYANDALREDINLDMDKKLTKFRDHIMNGISTVVGELKTIREEQSAHQLQHDDLSDIPERVEKLERVFEATPRR